MDDQRHTSDAMSDFSDLSEPPSTTTISTIAVQAGKAKIVLAILRSNEWIRVRIQAMEPDLMEVGSNLEEARALRREHDELLLKLNMKQKDVTELLARADDLASQNKPYQEVYGAMAETLGEAWKDLNAQLEYRKMLLDQSISFHESAAQFSEKMEAAQGKFTQVGVAHDVDTARRLLQQHQEFKKSILEASMSTLQEGQSLLDRIREMGMHADVQNRHATTAACYGIEHLLELLQDRRRHLEDLWYQRKIKLEQCLQLLLLDREVNKVSDWYSQVGDTYLAETNLGDSLESAQAIQEHHHHFEMQAKDIQETVLRLLRTADQLVHSAVYDAEGIKQRLAIIDTKTEDFMVRLDNRRKNLALAISFYSQALTALSKLDEIEVQLTSTDLPRNSAVLAERHAFLSNAIVEATTPALREGQILLERVSRDDSGAQGVSNKVTELQERVKKQEDMCKARYEAGERSQAYNQLQEKFSMVNTWLGRIGQATLSHYRDMGAENSAARDFLEIHERLLEDIKSKRGDVDALGAAAAELVKSGDQEAAAAEDKVKALRQEWDKLSTVVEERIKLARSYVSFHKKAQQLAIKMDALEQYLKIEKLDPAEVSDSSVKHKEEKYSSMTQVFTDVEGQGKTFIKEAQQSKDDQLDTRRAIKVVETTINHFSERKYMVTEYYTHWKVHISTGKEFKTQWHQFVQDARKTIDWVMKIEDEFFPLIAGELGDSMDNTKSYQKRLEEFSPTMKKAQAEIEQHLKTAEMLSLKGDTRGQKDQIVNELLKVHTRFQARISEYQVLLNMTTKFFKNLNQLDKLIETTEKEFAAAELPKEVTKAELLLREHEANRDKVKELITFSSEEGEAIVVRVRQQDSEALAKDEVQKMLQMTEERRRMWDSAWEEQHKRLEQNLQVCQFYFDLKQLHNELDELRRQLMNRHGNYGSSLSSVKMTSSAFAQFENNAQAIEIKVNKFVYTAETMIRVNHYDSRRIRHEVEQVQKKWHDFYGLIAEYREALNQSTKYFEVMDNAEDWVKDASSFLLQIGRKATECKSSDDATDLIHKLDDYRTAGANNQDDRFNFMEKIATTLYGPVSGPEKMQHIIDKNQAILDSFIKAIEELAILRDNLLKKEQILAQVSSAVQAEAPKAPIIPRFTDPLNNAEITEGQRFTFECKVECQTTVKIEWFKDDLALTSADYQTEFKDGISKMTIEETFGEDTAKYTCRASSDSGSAETSAVLKVRETHKKVVAPDITKHLRSQDMPEGTQFMFECHVSGIPSPDISWFKDDTSIDNSPGYVFTKINSTCCLKIRRCLKENSGRYTCKATNSGGEAASSAKLNVISVKKTTFDQPLCNVSAPEGKCVRMEAHFTAEPQPQIQWMKGETPIQPSVVFKIIVEHGMTALEISEVYPEDSGNFTVVARNLGGETRTSCLLTVEGVYTASEPETVDHEPTKPRITQNLVNKEVLEGSRARLDCVIVAHPEPEVIWYHNERPVKESKDFQLLFEGDRCSLIIREVYLEDSGEYKVMARNQYGMAESSCRLIVDPLSEMSDASVDRSSSEVVPPKFTQLLKDLEGIEGQKVRFECRLIGHPTPEVRWFREGKKKKVPTATLR